MFGSLVLSKPCSVYAQENADSSSGSSNSDPVDDGKKLSVDKLKKQYWSQSGNFDVVQNRLYSKAQRAEIALYGGFISSDPFLSIKNLGGSVGYHFNEFFSLHALDWKSYSSASQALQVLEQDTSRTANTNLINGFLGGELSASTVYGKLSLLGKAILYYDLHFNIGGGQTMSEVGNLFTQHVGIGQQIFLSKLFTIRLDYRLMHFRETILRKAPPSIGTPLEPRDNWSSVITLGVSLFVF